MLDYTALKAGAKLPHPRDELFRSRLVRRIHIRKQIKHDVLFFINAAKEDACGDDKNTDAEDGARKCSSQCRED